MLQALRLSVEDLFRDRSRTLLSLIGLSVVIASYIILSALSGAFSHYLSNTTISRNLIVVDKDIYNPSDATLEPQVIEAAQDLTPGMISRVSPFILHPTQVSGHVLWLRSAEQRDWEEVYHLVLVKGAWPGSDQEIVIDEGVALVNDWKIGSTLQVFSTDFKVSGIIRAPGVAFASVWMPIETFRKLFDLQRGYQALFVQVTAGVDPEVVRTQLENDPRLGGAYAVYFEENYSRRNIQFLKDLSSLITISSLMALLGIVFGIFNAVTLSMVERGYEIGILLGIGFSQRSVRNFLLIRFALLGLLAYAVGLAAAVLYSAVQQTFTPILVLGVPLELKVTPEIVLSGFSLVFILTLLGTWFSTRGLFNLRVVDLLRSS